MLKQGAIAVAVRLSAQFQTNSVFSLISQSTRGYQTHIAACTRPCLGGVSVRACNTTKTPSWTWTARSVYFSSRPFSQTSRSQAAQASNPEAATGTTRAHARVQDPRVQDRQGSHQSKSQPASPTAESEQIPVLERYPAIQQLRKVNFREGKEPYEIYSGSLTNQFRRLKLFSMLTSFAGLSIQPVVYQGLSESGAAIALLGIAPVFLFTYVTPIFIQILSKRYITEMFYNPVTDTYTGVTRNFFLQRKEFEFKLTDVIVPDVPGMLSTFLLKLKDQPGKTRPIFMMDTDFKYLEHYGRLMKFDQPIDLHLEEPESQSRNK